MFKLFSLLPNCVTQRIIAGYFRFRTWRTVGFRGYHSVVTSIKMSGYSVEILPALEDNYMYLLIDNKSKTAAIVDPVEPDKVLEAVKKSQVNLTSVLTTHHHWDHAGGNQSLVNKFTAGPLKVYGGDDRIEAITNKVQQGDEIKIGELKIRCLFTPCHTTGHICYYVEAPNEDTCVFTGDTLFSAGCGRFFEGTPDQMYSALIGQLAELPKSTQVYCGHEYTVSNLAYAKHVEPNNSDVLNKINLAKELRENNTPTVPSTIGDELLFNPFMRVNEPSVRAHANNSVDGIQTMGFLRTEKDSFKA